MFPKRVGRDIRIDNTLYHDMMLVAMKKKILLRWLGGNDFRDGPYLSLRGVLSHHDNVVAITTNTVLGRLVLSETDIGIRSRIVSNDQLVVIASTLLAGLGHHILPQSWISMRNSKNMTVNRQLPPSIAVMLDKTSYRYILDYNKRMDELRQNATDDYNLAIMLKLKYNFDIYDREALVRYWREHYYDVLGLKFEK